MKKITFELEDKEYVLPNFLSIEDYIKVYKVKDFLGEEFFQAKLINAITGAKMEPILNAGHSEISYISNYLLGLFPDSKYPFYDKFELDGIEYGFIPSWKNMSFAEFVDLDTLLTKKPEEIIENLHIICAIMYRPITSYKKKNDFEIEKYDSKTMVDRAEMFKKNLDVKYVLGGQFFFSQFAKQSLDSSQQSLRLKMKNLWMKTVVTWKMRKIIWNLLLNKPLDGSQLSTEFATTILQNTIISYKPPFWKRLINYFTFWKRKKS
jgi:hypothetical protein